MRVTNSRTGESTRELYHKAVQYRQGELIPGVKVTKKEACRIVGLAIPTYDYWVRQDKKNGNGLTATGIATAPGIDTNQEAA